MHWDLSNFIATLVVALPPTVTAILSYRSGQRTNNRVEEIKVSINGRMQQMLELAQGLGHATGQLQANVAQSVTVAAAATAATAAVMAAAPVVAAVASPATPPTATP